MVFVVLLDKDTTNSREINGLLGFLAGYNVYFFGLIFSLVKLAGLGWGLSNGRVCWGTTYLLSG